MSFCLSVCLSACVFLSVSLPVCMCLPVCLSVFLYVLKSFCLSFCLSVFLCLSVCQSVHPSACRYLSILTVDLEQHALLLQFFGGELERSFDFLQRGAGSRMRRDGAASRTAGFGAQRRRQSAPQEVGTTRRLLPARVEVIQAGLQITIVVVGLVTEKVRFVLQAWWGMSGTLNFVRKTSYSRDLTTKTHRQIQDQCILASSQI